MTTTDTTTGRHHISGSTSTHWECSCGRTFYGRTRFGADALRTANLMHGNARPVTLCDRRAASSAAPSNDDAARAAVRSLVETATDPRVALADIAALLKASDR